MQIPVTIIGGGIIGLTIAYELSEKYPELDIIIIEKEPYLGEHSTSRNSGVLHSGIYYPNGSLKHKFCIEGNTLWTEYAEKLDLKINRCGKFLVSTSKEEDLILEKYFKKALENKVKDVSWSDGEAINEVVNVNKSFFSKTTGILDVPEVLKALEKNLFNKNIPFLMNDEVIDIQVVENGYEIKTTREEFTTTNLINAAGCFAPQLRKLLGLNDLESYWVKGHYLKLNKKFYNDSLVYPVPTPGLKGLGVHTSFGVDGLIRFGPNTADVDHYKFEFEQGTFESMFESIKQVFPTISKDDLVEDYCGIRPKIKHNGELYSDFWVKGDSELGLKGYIELCGIESPGLTSAPAIARHVISKFFSNIS
jgi:L-2-hydroxyglutarate oxidase LhgO